MGVEGANVQVTVGEDGVASITYRASALGACTKRLVAERMGGYELMDPRGEKALAIVATMESGHSAEDEVVRLLAQDRLEVVERDSAVVLPVTKKIQVVGHVDGWVGGTIIEIKSMGQAAWSAHWPGDQPTPNYDAGFWPGYCWQISAYMLATNVPCIVYTYNRDTGELRRDEWTEPRFDMAAVRARVLGIERLARTFDLPGPCDKPTFPCPVFYLHESGREEFAEEDDGIIAGLAKMFNEKRAERDLAEKAYKAAQKTLLKAVGRTGKFETLDGWKVTAYDPGKGAWDTDKVKALIEAQGLDLDDYKAKSIRVTAPKEMGMEDE